MGQDTHQGACDRAEPRGEQPPPSDDKASASAGWALWDRRGRLVRFDSGFAALADAAGVTAGRGLSVTEMADALDLRLTATLGERGGEGWRPDIAAVVERRTPQAEGPWPDGRWLVVVADPSRRLGTACLFIDITGHIERCREAGREVTRLSDFAQASSDWLWEADTDMRFTFLSPTSERLRGSVRHILGRRREEVAADFDPASEAWRRHLEDTAARRPFRDFRYTVDLGNGRTARCSVSGVPVYNRGRFAGYRGTARDITDAAEREAMLTEARARLSGAIEVLDEGFTLWDGDDRLVLWNRRFEELLPAGMTRPRLGMTFSEILDAHAACRLRFEPAARVRAWRQDRLALRRRGNQSLVIDVGDGRWVRVTDRRTGGGTTVSVYADVTELKTKELALRGERARHAGIVAHIGDGVLTFDRDGRIASVNPAAEAIIGRDHAALKGRPLGEVLPAAGAAPPWGRNAEPADGDRREVTVARPDGTQVTVEAVTTMAGGADSLHGVVVLHDVTARARTERALREAEAAAREASRSKTEFLAAMSHELRTPLNAIIGFSEVMRSGVFGPIEPVTYRDYVADIHEAGGQLLRLVNDLLDIGRIEMNQLDLRLAPVSVSELLSPLARDYAEDARKRKCRLVFETPAASTVLADPRRLRQAVGHLLSNAVKFSNAGGEVRLSARHDDGGGVVITVADQGIGMDSDAIARAKQPFTQLDGRLARAYGGAGLGLALADRLVGLHGGCLRLDSAPGAGTTAEIRLPPAPPNDDGPAAD